MRIGIVCYPTHGGSGVVATELGIGLAERGHEVHFVSYATPFRLGSYYENVVVHEVDVTSYPLFKYPPYALALATKLVDLVHEYRLDLVHSHYAIPHAASAYLAKKILAPEPLKTITTLHGTDITLVGLDKSFNRVVRFAIEESDGVTAVSEYLRRKTIEEFGIQREIRVIYNSVDTQRYHPERDRCIREHFARPEEKLLMHISNYRPVKRVGDTVRVLARLLSEIPAKLVLVGEGPEKLAVQQLVKELKLQKSVIFLGQLDGLEDLLGCADLLLVPSETESFGLVALEAAASGVPVVATRTGGLPEVVLEGETGFLVPVGDIEEMAERALRVLTDPELQHRLGRRGRAIAEDRFRRELIIPQYESYYGEVLAS